MKNEITKGAVMELILKACPSYTKRWEDYILDN